MKKVKYLGIIAVCLFSLSIGLVFVANTSNVAYASTMNGNDFNKQYDSQYADIVDRYEQGIISIVEAEEEYRVLSSSCFIVNPYSTNTGGRSNTGGRNTGGRSEVVP